MANKEDNPTYQEAICGPDKADFIGAMGEEVLSLVDLDVYNSVTRTPDLKVISGVWALQQKQYPDDLLKHLKAQYYT